MQNDKLGKLVWIIGQTYSELSVKFDLVSYLS